MPSDAATLKDLLTRVQNATGSDRRLDYELFCAFSTPERSNLWDPMFRHFFTLSIDDALELVTRALPDRRISISLTLDDDPCAFASISHGAPTEGKSALYSSIAKEMVSAPLAILAAMLTMLIKEQSDAV